MPRPRLEAHLDGWAPLTVVHGLEGYGKTTLVASWLGRQPLDDVRALYVSAHPISDSLAELNAAIDHGLDRLGLARGGAAPPARRLARLRAAAAGLPDGQRLLLVIDDAQHLADPGLLGELVAIVRSQPAFHLVLCARGRHPIESLAAGRIDRCVVPADELLCSPEEIGRLGELLGVALDASARDQLHAALAGWIAPARLVLEAAAAAGTTTGFDLAPAQEYLRTTVLENFADRASLHRAMQLSLADYLDQAMIDELIDASARDQSLSIMEGSGLLTRHFDGERAVLRFPKLIRETMRAAYSSEYPDEARTFHRRLATWFQGHQRRHEDKLHAFRHAVAARDWSLADTVWTRWGSTLTMDYPQQCHQAVTAVPADVLAARPGWQVASSALRAIRADIDSDADGRITTLHAYIDASRARSDDLDALSLYDLLFIGTWRFIGLRATSYRQSAAYAARLHSQIAARLERGEDPGDRLPWFWMQRGVTHSVLGDDVAAHNHYLRAWHARTQDTATYVCANITANLAMTYAVRGDTHQARRWLARHAAFDTAGSWGHHLVDVGARVAGGLLALDRLDQHAADAETERWGAGSAPLALWPFIAYLHAQRALHFGDPEAALAALDDAAAADDDHHAGGSRDHRLLTLARADLLLALGRAQAAGQLLRTNDERHPAGTVALARTQLFTGNHPAARAALAPIRHSAGPRERLELHLIEAAAALHLNDEQSAARHMTQALESYRRTGILRAFTAIPREDLDSLLSMVDRPPSPDDLEILANARAVFPPSQPAISLTRRERTLVSALRNGRTRQETADELHLSVNTVKSQYADLYRKLRVNSRGEALVKLEELGL